MCTVTPATKQEGVLLRISTFFLTVVPLVICVATVQARIIHVPEDSTTIHGAINGAVDGDTVMVAPGMDYDFDINLLDKDITVMSAEPEDSAISDITVTDVEPEDTVAVELTPSEIPETKPVEHFDLSKRYRITGSFLAGGGSEKFDVFRTTGNEWVTISPGGGYGAKLDIGYCLNSLLNVNLEIGNLSSPTSKKLSNAKGSFSRTFLLGTVRYRIPINEKSSFNVAGGAGYYMSGKLDIDASKIQDGAHNILKYKGTTGIHVLGEYERFFSGISWFNAKWSWSAGVRYYNVKYKIDSATKDGQSQPVSSVSKELQELNGSGSDVFFSIIMYL
jgi:hypothetical protein